MNWLTNLNLNRNELQNVVIQNLTTAPTNPKVGMIYYNTTQNRYFGYNGTSWVAMDSKDVGDDTIAALFQNGAPVAGIQDNHQFAVILDESSLSKTTYSFWSDMKSNLKSYFDTFYNKYMHPNHTGDVTSTGDGATTIVDGKVSTAKIANDAVTNAKLANMAVNTIKGRATAGTGDPEDLTAAQVKTILSIPTDAKYTDTVTTINGKTGAIAKADIVALGIPAQDTVYTHPTGDGNLHVPATNISNNGKVLTAGTTAGSISWKDPTVTWDKVTAIPPNLTEAMANWHSHSNYGIIETYDQSNDDLTDAVAKKHTQNTDTGTRSKTFSLDNTMHPLQLKANLGELSILDLSGGTLADLKVKNLTVDGTTTIINSNTVNIGDNEIELNCDVTASTQNSDGGIAIKRLKTDNTTRSDARLTFNNSTGKWQTTSGLINGTLVTAQIASKMVFEIGDGTNTEYILTHNLGTKDLAVSIRETYPQDGYQLVYTDVRFIDENRIKVIFANAPATNQYKVTIVG